MSEKKGKPAAPPFKGGLKQVEVAMSDDAVMEEMQLGKPAQLENVDIDFGNKDTPVRHFTRGVKKKKKSKELFKEQMRLQFEQRMRNEFQHIVGSVVRAAKKGDMRAAKLIFDRVIPAGKAEDLGRGGSKPVVNITIGQIAAPEPEESDIVSEQ